MTLFKIYVWVSMALFVLLGTVWTRNTWVNVFLKIAFWFLAITGFLIGLAVEGVVLVDGKSLL